MTMYSTAHVEHYADQYAAAMLHKHGVSLDQYLACPARYEHLLTAPFPLLPAQTKVRVRLFRQEAIQEEIEQIAEQLDNLPRNNVRPFKPMRHLRHPKKRGRASSFRPNPQTI